MVVSTSDLASPNSSFKRLLLVVETGNTSTSFGVFQGAHCLHLQKVASHFLTTVDGVAVSTQPLLAAYPALADAMVCSVVPQVEEVVIAFLHDVLVGTVLRVSAALPLPFELEYHAPATFGADRLALCAWSCITLADEAVIALDIGTACTIDVVSSRKRYFGGMIMPGLELMARSLHEHTARLPLVKVSTKPASLLGHSTAECMERGIVWSCAAGLDGIVQQLAQWLRNEHQEQAVRVVATGGGAPLVTSLFAHPCIVDELAVMQGARLLFSS